MNFRIKNVVVLGSGVMGSGIACQLANVGLKVLMLDILPQGQSQKNNNNRNSVAQDALTKTIKSSPAPLYIKEYANRIKFGNFEDDFEKIKGIEEKTNDKVYNLELKSILLGGSRKRGLQTNFRDKSRKLRTLKKKSLKKKFKK